MLRTIAVFLLFLLVIATMVASNISVLTPTSGAPLSIVIDGPISGDWVRKKRFSVAPAMAANTMVIPSVVSKTPSINHPC